MENYANEKDDSYGNSISINYVPMTYGDMKAMLIYNFIQFG